MNHRSNDSGSADELPTVRLARRPRAPASRSPEDLLRRRAEVRKWWLEKSRNPPANLVGLALSGGGIRSATFSLGIIQALARSERNALAQVDILSTVSGGGYVGCFLRSLFMPDEGRGILPVAGSPQQRRTRRWKDAVAEQAEFAGAVLASNTKAVNLKWTKRDGTEVTRRNPLWWLREHSRYLAPNGPTDYAYAVAYIARNWVAMLYIFLIASLAISALVVSVEAAYFGLCSLPHGSSVAADAAQHGTVCAFGTPWLNAAIRVSPLFTLGLPVIAFTAIVAVAYWITQGMSPNEQDIGRQWKNLLVPAAGTLLASIIVIAAATWINSRSGEGLFSAPQAANEPVRDWLGWLDAYSPRLPLPDFGAGMHGRLLALALLPGLAIALAATGLAVGLGQYMRVRKEEALTIELRGKLTSWLASSIKLLVAIVLLGMIDTLGARIAQCLPKLGLRASLLVPALAILVKKLPDWFGRSSKIASSSSLQRFLPALSVVVGLFLFGTIAVAAAIVAHSLAWQGSPWTIPSSHILLLFVILVFALAVLAGTGNGFINLSSLHFLYASRLTRAFLGATNNERLAKAALPGDSGNVRDTDKADYIQPPLYFTSDLPAPIHVINITLNETIDPESQLVARDRKGWPLSLGPGGVEVGTDIVPWKKLGHGFAEQLSLGQWCAISGAAISSGMGRLTSLGYALTLTFANVRLGYWWWAPGLCRSARKQLSGPARLLGRWFSTFVYLWNEMTARYSRFYRRKYLTDGGHFENTAAYRLIERKVPLIIVSDNGADANYRFEDLENLVRKVRLDFGGEMQMLGGAELATFLQQLGTTDRTIFVDPEGAGDWRDQFISADSKAYVLVARATLGRDAVHLIWLKPRLLKDTPPDVLVYGSANRPFPQQPTGDQFFDEAQWESYRKLGEICMSRLLAACPRLLLA